MNLPEKKKLRTLDNKFAEKNNLEISLQNWEFQWYTNNRSNSFAKEGKLHIRPTLTSDTIGEEALTSGTLDVQGNYPAEVYVNLILVGQFGLRDFVKPKKYYLYKRS